MIALYGGVFDPPHNGHVALAEAALGQFQPDELLVLVASVPGHKEAVADAERRLELARLAFGGLARTRVESDDHAWTVDLLRDRAFADPLFLVGADEFADFFAWKEPDEVLALTRVGVATRPGYPQGALDAVLGRISRPDRVEFFDIPAMPISSDEIRARIRSGQPVTDVVPEAVLREIEDAGLYQ